MVIQNISTYMFSNHCKSEYIRMKTIIYTFIIPMLSVQRSIAFKCTFLLKTYILSDIGVHFQKIKYNNVTFRLCFFCRQLYSVGNNTEISFDSGRENEIKFRVLRYHRLDSNLLRQHGRKSKIQTIIFGLIYFVCLWSPTEYK